VIFEHRSQTSIVVATKMSKSGRRNFNCGNDHWPNNFQC